MAKTKPRHHFDDGAVIIFETETASPVIVLMTHCHRFDDGNGTFCPLSCLHFDDILNLPGGTGTCIQTSPKPGGRSAPGERSRKCHPNADHRHLSASGLAFTRISTQPRSARVEEQWLA